MPAIGYSSLDAYAEERLGMAPSRARALLRIARAASECPPLRKAFATGRLSWVQAHALVPLLLEPASARHRRAWVRHAERVSVRRLSDDIESALGHGRFAPLCPSPALARRTASRGAIDSILRGLPFRAANGVASRVSD